MTLRHGSLLGSYRILHPIGTGGMGEVYLAEDTRLHRQVALKVLPQLTPADRERRERFEREAQAAARLNHPNIVTIHSIEEADGVPFLTMEYVSGKPLGDILPPAGLPLRQLLAYAIPLADAVSAAHERGIVHRDLKPGNIIVADDGRVKVLDFGLAKLKEDASGTSLAASGVTAPLTSEGKILGTTPYMSPEQAEGQPVDHRSDIFSLGVILYEMGTGRRPFQGPSGAAVISAILRDVPPLVTDIRPDLPSEFGRIVRRCLAKDRTRRFQTALDLRNELEELKEDSESRSAPAVRSAASGARRWRLAGIAAAAVVAVAAIWSISSWRASPPAADTADLSTEFVERQITSSSVEDPVAGAVISPDGKYIVYADFKGIHIRLIETGETRLLNSPPEMCFTCSQFAWSQDGTKVLTAGPSGPNETTGLWVISTLTGELRKLADDVGFAAFSPDGSQIAYIGGNQREIWIMAAGGGERRLLAAGTPDRTLGDITWMPDGHSVAYSAYVPAGDPTIQTRRISDGQWTFVMNVPRLRDFCVTRDGRLLYTQTDPPPAQNTYGLWAVQIEPHTGRAAADRRRLTRWTGQSPGAISVASDGRRGVVTLGRTQQDVYVGDIAADGAEVKNIRRLTLSTTDDAPAGWLPDSRTVLVSSDRNGTFDIFRQRLGDPDAATSVAGPGDTRDAQVSPDGSWLLYMEGQGAGAESPTSPARLLRTPLTGGGVELVLETARAATILPFLCPRAANVPCVLYEREETHDVFTAFSPTGGRGREVARTPRKSARWALSHDGSLIAYMPVARRPEPMTVFTIPTGASRQIELGDLNRTRGFDWIAGNRALLFVQGTLRQSNLFLVPLDGTPRSLLTLPPNAGSPMVSPDGKYLAYSRYTTERNAWLLEGNRR